MIRITVSMLRTACLRLATLLLLFPLATVCGAQSSVDGSVDGTATDGSGAVLAGAHVSIMNKGTNAIKTVDSDSSGYFRATALSPGSYKVSVAAQGFGTYVAEIVVEVGRITDITATLQAGSTEAVEVTAEAPVLNTESADFNTNFNQASIQNLPINGRHWTSFALLTPGVVASGNFGLVSVRGISNLQNNFSVDGSDDNQAFQSVERGYTRVGYSTAQASIQEFQVNTSNYSAQYGRAAGGGVNAITKSGSNAFHGEAFWYYRDNDFGATNPFTLLNGVHIKPKDKRHQWGGALGGPLVKDKLFFFYAYDQQKRNFPITAVPTAAFLANETAAATVAAARGVSAANTTAAFGYVNALSGLIPRFGNQIINFPKLDWKINDRNTASVMYNRMRWDSPGGIQTNPVIQRSITSAGNDFVKVDSIIANVNTALSSRLNNTLRYEHARDFEYEFAQKAQSIEPTTGPGGLPPETYINTNGGFYMGTPDYSPRGKYPDERENQVVDTVTYVKGNHTLTTGFDFRHVNNVDAFLNPQEGEFTYSGTNALANFVTDYARGFLGSTVGCDAATDSTAGALPCYGTYQQQFGTPQFAFNTNEYAFFAQDDLKLFSNLTLNFGLRYEYEQLPVPQIPNAALPQSAVFPSDKNNVGPRFGFAWQPFHSGKQVVRGGYGLYFGRIQNGTIFQALSGTAASAAQFNYSLLPTAAGAPVYPATLATGNAPAKSNVKVFDPGFQAPAIQEGDLIVQQELPWNTVFSVGYLLSIGRQLPNFVDQNVAPSTTTKTYSIVGGPLAGQTYTVPFYTTRVNTAAFNQITDIKSNVNSSYNALTVQADHRFSHGLQFQLSYVWSKALDQGMNQTQGADANDPFDPFTQKLDKGKSVVNVPQRFVASLVWKPTLALSNKYVSRVANGWTLSPISTLQSGIPYSYVVSGGATGGLAGATATLNGSGGGNYIQTLGRDAVQQPNIQDVDLRLSREFAILEKYRLEALVESFNVLNRQNITGVNTTAYTNSGTTLTYQSSFGVPTAAGNTLYRERQIQFALRLQF